MLMYGSLKASATNKYRCLVILEALQSVSGAPKIIIVRGMAQWKSGVFPPPPPPTLHHAAAPRKKALVFRSKLLKPAYFFAPPTSKAGGEPCTIQRSTHNAAVLIISTLCWLL